MIPGPRLPPRERRLTLVTQRLSITSIRHQNRDWNTHQSYAYTSRATDTLSPANERVLTCFYQCRHGGLVPVRHGYAERRALHALVGGAVVDRLRCRFGRDRGSLFYEQLHLQCRMRF